jgi:hypothetical protein
MEPTDKEFMEADFQEEVEVESFTDWPKEPTVMQLKQDYLDATSDTDMHITKVETWLDNLNIEGKAKPKTKKGRSSVQPKVIRKQAEWRYASLSEPFLSTPDMFTVRPKTFEDTSAAEQNSLLLNYQFAHKIGKVNFIDEYIRTFVDEGTVIVKNSWVYEDEEIEVEKPIFEYEQLQDPQMVEELQGIITLMDDNPYEFSLMPEDVQESAKISISEGKPIMARISGMEMVPDIKVLKNYPALEICDFRNITVDPSCQGDTTKAMFIIHSFSTSKAKLKAAGKYKNIDNINADANSVLSDPDHQGEDEGSFNFSDNARKNIIAYEYWGFRDVHGDGLLTPILATYVGDIMIQMAELPFADGKLPFTFAQYLPVRKSNFGEPDGELIEDNQKIVGAVTRGMIDIMARGANGQQATRKDALDLTNKRKFDSGEDYEFNATVDPKQAFHMHTYAEIPQSAQIMLQMQHADAESLTGVKAFSSGLSGKALGNTATGIRSAMDATAQRELGILRRAAQGIQEIGHKMIAMNSIFLDEEEVVRVTNSKFVPIRKDDLTGEFDIELEISTADADNAKAEELSFMLQTTGQTMGEDFTRMVMSKIAKLRKMPDLSKAIEEFQPEPDPFQEQMQQLEIAKIQAEIAEIQSKTAENYAEAQLDGAKAQTEGAKATNLGSDTDQKNLNYVEQESGLKQQRELQKMGEQGEVNKEVSKVNALTNAALDKENTLIGESDPENPTVSNGLDQR